MPDLEEENANGLELVVPLAYGLKQCGVFDNEGRRDSTCRRTMKEKQSTFFNSMIASGEREARKRFQMQFPE